MGPELGEEARKTAVIVKALYGLKLAGAAVLNNKPGFIAKTRNQIRGWMQYYSYFLCYLDGILCIYHNAYAAYFRIHFNYFIGSETKT